MFQTKFLCSSFVIEKCSISKCLFFFFFLQNFFATFTVTLDWEGKIGTGWPRCEVSSASSRSDSQRDCKASGRVGDRIVVAQEVRNFGIFLEMSNLMIVIYSVFDQKLFCYWCNDIMYFDKLKYLTFNIL